MLSFREAAKYLGRHEQTLEYYHKKGLLRPSQRYGANEDRVYTKESLDAFRLQYLSSPYLTIKDIAAKYNQDESRVHYFLRMKNKVEPAGRRGNTLTFREEDVERIANKEGWTTSRTEQEDRLQ